MEKEEIQALSSQFEQVSCILNDVECWSARDLCTLLGYKEWRNFTKAIEKAINANSLIIQEASGKHRKMQPPAFFVSVRLPGVWQAIGPTRRFRFSPTQNKCSACL